MQEQPYRSAEPPKGLSVAALVLGIIGLCMSVIPWCNWAIAIPCSILAIVFGSSSLSLAREGIYGGESLAKAGRVCGIIGFGFIIMWIVLMIAAQGIAPKWQDHFEFDNGYEPGG